MCVSLSINQSIYLSINLSIYLFLCLGISYNGGDLCFRLSQSSSLLFSLFNISVFPKSTMLHILLSYALHLLFQLTISAFPSSFSHLISFLLRTCLPPISLLLVISINILKQCPCIRKNKKNKNENVRTTPRKHQQRGRHRIVSEVPMSPCHR